jgi:hypothetical protein
MDFEDEIDKINEIFGDCDFTISIPLKDIDNILTTKEEIKVIHTFTCYCYDGEQRDNNVYKISNKTGPMTIKYVIQQLIKQGLECDCNHQFLESFDKIDESTFEMFFGS